MNLRKTSPQLDITYKELRQAAVNCLAQAFKGKSPPPPHVVQAAVSVLMVLLTPEKLK